MKYKVYVHEGKGRWIGSCVVLFAESMERAEVDVRTCLDREGLEDEPLNIREVENPRPRTILNLIYVGNGDY